MWWTICSVIITPPDYNVPPNMVISKSFPKESLKLFSEGFHWVKKMKRKKKQTQHTFIRCFTYYRCCFSFASIFSLPFQCSYNIWISILNILCLSDMDTGRLHFFFVVMCVFSPFNEKFRIIKIHDTFNCILCILCSWC